MFLSISVRIKHWALCATDLTTHIVVGLSRYLCTYVFWVFLPQSAKTADRSLLIDGWLECECMCAYGRFDIQPLLLFSYPWSVVSVRDPVLVQNISGVEATLRSFDQV